MLFLIMQFLWKYIDDIMGKGVEYSIIFKLLFFTSANIIPLALPIAVLFSSIMTMGNLAENNELTAMKSSGMSLFKIMRPMFIFMVILSLSTFYFSNYILPIANLKQRTIIYDLQTKKPAFALTEGVFYNDIDNFSIKVDKKNKKTGELYGVLIYENKGGNKIIRAKTGEMISTEDNHFLFLKLNDGVIYEEANLDFDPKAKYPYRKSFFDETVVKFDMSDFSFKKSDEDLFKRDFEMMNFVQLGFSIDSFELSQKIYDSLFIEDLKKEMVIFNPYNLAKFEKDTINLNVQIPSKLDTIIIFDSIPKSKISNALLTAQNKIRAKKDFISMNSKINEFRISALKDYKVALHQKFTLSFAILVLFFIGAPLGAIIRKGGLGAPLIFATLFFLLYYILTISGENMVDSGMMEPVLGIWIASIILVPLGLFLTYKAANDSALFDMDVYKKIIKIIFKKEF